MNEKEQIGDYAALKRINSRELDLMKELFGIKAQQTDAHNILAAFGVVPPEPSPVCDNVDQITPRAQEYDELAGRVSAECVRLQKIVDKLEDLKKSGAAICEAAGMPVDEAEAFKPDASAYATPAAKDIRPRKKAAKKAGKKAKKTSRR